MKEVKIQGFVHSNAGLYLRDQGIGFDEPGRKLRSNSYGNLQLFYRKFSAGLRYEAYMPPLLGYDQRYDGHGIANLYGMYTTSRLSFTLGSFYEQFGSGLIMRTYENQNLGIDNSLTGARLTFSPFRGILLKTFIGRQRNFWALGKGVIRGVDGEWNITETTANNTATNLIAGVSMVSRYQKDLDPLYKLPENVAAFSGRLSFYRSGFQLSGEYGFKINDPAAMNNMIYKNGSALILNGSYAAKGIGLLLSGKWSDNMDFRSERGATGNSLTLGFTPCTFAEHTYSLAAMYPYVSQPFGEAAIRSEITWSIPKGSTFGGLYGTTLVVQLARAQSILKKPVHPAFPVGSPGTKGYRSSFLAPGDEKYFSDISLEINRKLTPDFRTVAGFTHIFYNISALQGHPGEPDVKATTFFVDLSFRLTSRQSLRAELQHLQTKQDNGSWAMALLEYSMASGWMLSCSDQYNYGNDIAADKDHYPLLNLSYTIRSQRFNLSFGRQREGLVCIGGVCRYVPASSGFGMVYTFTF